MKRAITLLVAAAACGGGAKPAPPVTPHAPRDLPPADPRGPLLSDVAWLAGTWRTEVTDEHWQEVAGAFYGVALPRDPEEDFEIYIIDDTDLEGQRAPITLHVITGGTDQMRFALDHATANEIMFKDPQHGMMRFTHGPKGPRGSLVPPEGVSVTWDTRPIELDSGAVLEAADREFDADTAKDGADGWARHFDEHGAMWRPGRIISGPAKVREVIANTLAHGTLRWAPVASGIRDNLGFTLGTGTFTPTSGTPAKVSYCTIWKHQADGSWKVLFDIGRPAD